MGLGAIYMSVRSAISTTVSNAVEATSDLVVYPLCRGAGATMMFASGYFLAKTTFQEQFPNWQSDSSFWGTGQTVATAIDHSLTHSQPVIGKALGLDLKILAIAGFLLGYYISTCGGASLYSRVRLLERESAAMDSLAQSSVRHKDTTDGLARSYRGLHSALQEVNGQTRDSLILEREKYKLLERNATYRSLGVASQTDPTLTFDVFIKAEQGSFQSETDLPTAYFAWLRQKKLARESAAT